MKKQYDTCQEKYIMESLLPNDLISYIDNSGNKQTSSIVKVIKHFWTKYINIRFITENGDIVKPVMIYSYYRVKHN